MALSYGENELRYTRKSPSCLLLPSGFSSLKGAAGVASWPPTPGHFCPHQDPAALLRRRLCRLNIKMMASARAVSCKPDDAHVVGTQGWKKKRARSVEEDDLGTTGGFMKAWWDLGSRVQEQGE